MDKSQGSQFGKEQRHIRVMAVMGTWCRIIEIRYSLCFVKGIVGLDLNFLTIYYSFFKI